MAEGTQLNGTLRRFIDDQKVFFVATAAPDGRVNLSPKGADSLRILSDTHVRWLNLSGSGNETAGHIKQTNRITMMFCAFEGDALILRLYGRATVTHPYSEGWSDVISDFPEMAGSRQVFDVKIESVQTSCGTGVPIMPFQESRVETELLPFYADMGPDGVAAYWRKKNLQTIDGFDTGLLQTPDA